MVDKINVAERHIKQVFQYVSFLSGSPDMPQSACVLTATFYTLGIFYTHNVNSLRQVYFYSR